MVFPFKVFLAFLFIFWSLTHGKMSIPENDGILCDLNQHGNYHRIWNPVCLPGKQVKKASLAKYSTTTNSDDDSSPKDKVNVGAILDLTTRRGKEEMVAMQMAIQDFYSDPNHRPLLNVRDSRGDPMRALSAAKILANKDHVATIMGLETWQETVFVAELGNKSEVPILSMANEVPLWARQHWPYLVNTARSQFAQMKAVAAIVSSWQWRKVNIIYEDISSAVSGIIPFLISALQDTGLEIRELLPLPSLTSYYSLSDKLKQLKDGQYKVFIVHTSATLGVNIFMEAKSLGMMEKDSVWITTDAITNSIDTFNTSVISSMQGVLGVKSYYSRSGKNFKHFHSKFVHNFKMTYPDELYPEPGIYALQAYDAMWAAALAMEGHPFRKSFRNSTYHDLIRGKKLLHTILCSNFVGFTGAFKFRKGMLTPSHIFQIVNVVGRSHREIGYWNEKFGSFANSIVTGSNYSKSMNILGQVFWPGGPWSIPRGWALPTQEKPIKIGVPTGNAHKEFIDVESDAENVSATGFAVDVFSAAISTLGYDLPLVFVAHNGTYDTLVGNLSLQTYDAVVADIAIVADRCKNAEFSQPYSESGIQMVVYAEPKTLNRPWLFLRPFTPRMWMWTMVITLCNGAAVWDIERGNNPEFNRNDNLFKQVGTIFTSAFITLFSLKGDGLHSNWSRMAMAPWLLVALVTTQSFTASLTSLLTSQELNPVELDVATLKESGKNVGCDADSFVGEYLRKALHFSPENIVPVHSDAQYAQSLREGEIAAAFLEVPYIKVFLAKYCRNFTTSGQVYKVGGFGFGFQKGSPYLPDISEAVVNVSESGQLNRLEKSLTSSYNCSDSDSDSNVHERLDITSFSGLFIFSGVTSAIAWLLSLIHRFMSQNYRIWTLFGRQQQQQQQLELQELHQHVQEVQGPHHPLIDEQILFAFEMQNQARTQ